jgi:quercetin dioxygenase-like cupin family protein
MNSRLLFVAAFLIAGALFAQDAQVIPVLSKGSVVMQVKGGIETTLIPGQSFYEGPNDVHVVGRNASTTKPAKFVVFLVKNKDAPVLTVVK